MFEGSNRAACGTPSIATGPELSVVIFGGGRLEVEGVEAERFEGFDSAGVQVLSALAVVGAGELGATRGVVGVGATGLLSAFF